MSLDEEKFLVLDGLVQWTSATITQADRLASRTVVIMPPATGVVLMIVGASAIRTPSANPPRTPCARAGQTGYRIGRASSRDGFRGTFRSPTGNFIAGNARTC